MEIQYKKYFKFNSDKRQYVLSLKSILENNEEKLLIKLSNILKDNSIISFHLKKTLFELYEDKNLIELTSIKSIIDYLSGLINHNKMKIYNINKLITNIVFIDNNKNIEIKFILKRIIDHAQNEEMIEDIENEFVNMYKNMENMKRIIQSQNSKLFNLEEKYSFLCQKYEEISSNINNNNNNNRMISQIRDSNINNAIEIDSSVKNEKENKNDISKSKTDNDSSYSSYIKSFIKSSNNEISKNNSYNNNFQENYEENEMNIHKENNCEIKFQKDPTKINNKKFIMDEVSDEECEDFIAFNITMSQPIIAWITKKQNKDINIINWAKKGNTYKHHKNLHQGKINKLQYYHNDNKNKEYLISLSFNDKESLKIWEIDLGDLTYLDLILVKSFENKINCFCMFSNKNYSDNYNYLITSTNKKSINIHKLDNELQKEECYSLLDCKNNINFLDIFYHKKNNDIYLLNCNSYDVNVIRNPFDKFETKSFKKSNNHFNAFIIEKNNKLEIFEANIEGIFIWDYDNNDKPIKEISIGLTFDICLWNDNYLWVSNDNGFTLIPIDNENEEIIPIDMNKSDKKRILSKIRKINSPKENESIIGIDFNRKLCLWTY